MIPQITEVNFPSYATLSNATATFSDMGERVITTEVKIDGSVVPDFSGWELRFRGERFVLSIKEPQAAKDNTSIKSTVSLTFHSWAILQLKRYFMFTVPQSATGFITADKYNASVSLSLTDFCALLNQVLTYYFGSSIYVDLKTGVTADAALVEMNYAYIWDVLQKVYETYGVKWRIEYVQNTNAYAIRIGYTEPTISDHDFEYGYEGGLMRFERQVQDEDIHNILLGRGGEKNVPYRYFKDADPNNPGWAADPDWVPELANVYFDRIRDANFRSYVQGWRTNYWGQAGAIDGYDAARGATDWAYEKGHTDIVFDPVEYVKDDASITKYGEHWGHLDDNDDIYPTIQGVTRNGVRVDTTLGVSPILTDDIAAAASGAAQIVDITGVLSQVDSIPVGNTTKEIRGSSFTIPAGMTANLMDNGYFVTAKNAMRAQKYRLTADISNSSIRVFRESTGTEVSREGITAGTYYYVITVRVLNLNSAIVDDVTYGVNGLYLMMSASSGGEWKPTFDIYVCNIWGTTQGNNETDDAYSRRVWGPILGDHLGSEAKVVFADGFMSISEDYDFTIATYPMPDRSVTLNGVRSEWRITLNKCSAEFDATGLYIPNTTTGGKPIAGDHFFFTGIDMPYFYVTEAEKRLTQYKEDALPENAEVNPTWAISLDKIRIDEEYNQNQERLIDKIDAGVGFNITDTRFTGGETLLLYASSVTFRWSESTIILPEVEVVLSEKTTVVKSSYAQLQSDVSTIKSNYATVRDISSETRDQGSQLYLGKTGEDQTSMSPTRFASIVSSKNFKQGEVGGEGWGFYEDNSDVYQDSDGVSADNIPPQSVLEVDRLVVRRDLLLNKLIINHAQHVGGRQIVSAAAVEVTNVVASGGSYTCYFDQKLGAVQNLFEENDIALCETYDGAGEQARYYRMLVTAVGLDYVVLAGSGADGYDTPEVGDTLIQYGNTTDDERKYVIIRDVVGGGREYMLSGLNSTSATGTEYYYAGIKEIEGPEGAQGLEPAPYFHIGNQNSYIKFNSRKGKMYLKGNLVQSPAGTEFPVPCWRREYDDEATYYPGDLVTYNGESWLHEGDTPITGVTPGTGESWHKYAEKGAAGESILAQYSETAQAGSWHDTFQSNDVWMRTKKSSDQDWGAAMRIVGEDGRPGADGQDGQDGADGTPGPYTQYSFAYSSDLTTASPTTAPSISGSWQDAPPAPVSGKYLWMKVQKKKWGTSSYINDGSATYARIEGEDGQDGAPGADGASIQVQYSANGSSGWHSEFSESSDKYMRTRVGSSGSWSAAMRIVGENGRDGTDGTDGTDGQDGQDGSDGTPGPYTDYSFAYSSDLTTNSPTDPPTISGSWQDAPPAPVSGKYLWMKIQKKKWGTSSYINDGSATYARIEGEKGDKGDDGDPGSSGTSVLAQYSANGTSWHSTFASGDIWMRTSSDGGTSWTSAIRIVGEKGDPGTNGPYTDYTFAYSPNLTSAQSDGCPTNSGTDGSSGQKITTWYDAPPAAVSGQYLWMKVQKMVWGTDSYVTDGNPTYTRISGQDGQNGTNGTDGTDGQDGSDGYSAATIYLYQRSSSNSSQLTAPGNTTYTFATGALTGTLNSWSLTIPDGTNPCYVTMCNVKENTATVSITGGYKPNGSWSTPTRLTGDNGLRGKVMRGVNEWSSSGLSGGRPNGSNGYQGLFETDTSVIFYDIVYTGSGASTRYFYCKDGSTSGATTYKPGRDTGWTNYWSEAENFDFIATRVLLAQYADIDILSGNAVYMHDDGDANIVAGMQGGSVATGGVPQINFFAGTSGSSPNPLTAPFRVDFNGKVVAENAEITGAINASGSKFTDNTYSYAIKSGNGLLVADGHTRLIGDSVGADVSDFIQLQTTNGEPPSSSSRKLSMVTINDDNIVLSSIHGSNSSSITISEGELLAYRNSNTAESLTTSPTVKHIVVRTTSTLPSPENRDANTLYIVT